MKHFTRLVSAALAAVDIRWLGRALALCLLAAGGIGSAQAQSCGFEGQRACTIFEHIPSCYGSKNLVESAGRCVHPDCGRDGQSACGVLVRIPSCDDNLLEYGGKCYVPGVCGNEGQRACTVPEHVPSCRSKNLIESAGKCVHPDCGRDGQSACGVLVRLPSCDDSLIEYGGKCYVPNACGNENQRACTVPEHFPSCRSSNLVESAGRCVHPDCGRLSQSACGALVRIPSCDDNLVEYAGRCYVPNICGDEGQRGCAASEHIPSCKSNTLVESGGLCIHPACGRENQVACAVNIRIPSCDGSLVEYAGKCYVRNVCGNEGQRGCATSENIPSCKNKNLVESGGLCVHPACGRLDQAACGATVRVPSCDDNLVEYGGKCYVPNACGNEGQRACTIAENVPSCRSANLVESAGACVHPDCGRVNQTACNVATRVPSCDDPLLEYGGTCFVPNVCGNEGQRPCTVRENVPSCRSKNLIESLGQCIHPPCGREGQAACLVGVRIPSCDDNLFESAGMCRLHAPCGGQGQPLCNWRIPACDPFLLPSAGQCVHPACGRLDESACTVTTRIPSCDDTLVEYGGKCYVRDACGEAGQRACTLAEHFPSCRSSNLVESDGKCVAPVSCGREGQRPCSVLERLPSCDPNLVELPFGQRCTHPACGREQQRACLIPERLTACDTGLTNLQGNCVPESPCNVPSGRVPVVAPVPDNAPINFEVESGFDRPGSDFRNFDLAQADPMQCKAECTATAGCRAWTYVKPTMPGVPAHCWLKNAVPDPVPKDCCSSGTTTMPRLAPPASLTATRVGRSDVRLTWTPASGAIGYKVLRDGQVIAANVRTTFLEDRQRPNGTYAYAVQSLYPALAGPQPSSIPGREARIQIGPFRVLAIGDSVMWGQGLSDAVPARKYAPKVRDWLQGQLGVDVELVSLAHSGASIAGAGPLDEQLTKQTPGEVPNTYPTILAQSEMAGRRFTRPRDVDLVLLDGCINDVSVTTFLNPFKSAGEIQTQTADLCGRLMPQLLNDLHQRYPSAQLVVNGYFPVVSEESDLTAIAVLASGVLISVGPVLAPLIPFPKVSPVVGLVVGFVATEVVRSQMAANSWSLYSESTVQIAQSLRDLNASSGRSVGAYACVPFGRQNSYAARDSWLWLVPTDLYPKDEVFNQRGQICNDDRVMTASGSTADSMAVDRVKCQLASMGHPNVPGADAYFRAITEQLQVFLPSWKEKVSPTQRAPR